MGEGFRIVQGFPEPLRQAAAELYFDAFADKLGGVLGRDGRGKAFLADILDPAYCICALSTDGDALLGFVGFKTRQGAMTGGTLDDLARPYGRYGAFWRGIVLSLLERGVEPDVFLLDGIAVAPDARGTGIGTALLDAVQAEAIDRSCRRIRLDVIDTNPRARALYERRGFIAVSRERLGPLRHVFGFSAATRMEKALND